MTTKLTIDNFSDVETIGISWQSVKTSSFTAVAGEGYFCNTTSSAFTVTLPSSPSAGDSVAIKDYAGTFASNNLTIARNGENIQGAANDSLISTNRASVTLVYIDSTKGWLYTDEHNVGDLQLSTFITATGGTITTSGDYKIHTFTGDGCFVVSSVGNGPLVPTGGPNTVSYVVVAGGGSGGGHSPGTASSYSSGGGGAGGFREGQDITPSYTASPLVAPTGLTITQTTYPVTVGGGGATKIETSPNQGNPGSPSSFSTITSTGGGGGARGGASDPGDSGGSGGGISMGSNTTGAGNTPPVSPPQGNPGGTTGGGIPNRGAAGGGGAGVAGTNNPSGNDGTPGGDGVTTSISGSPTAYAGGGGAGGWNGSTKGNGGTGGGGNGGQSSDGFAGTANTGGGGGGSGPINVVGGSTAQDGGAGGKGIVIIRYKFQ